MILTKDEFKQEYEYDNSSVCRLIKKKQLILDKKGMIDTENETNKELVKKRKARLQKSKKTKKQKKEEKSTPKNQKSEQQISLEFDLLSAKFQKASQENALLTLKIAKEKGELIETEVLNRVILNVFEALFKTLTDLPHTKADEIIALVKINENPKEALVKLLSDDIINSLKDGLANAKEITQKYFNR